jgi:hypothetical protein
MDCDVLVLVKCRYYHAILKATEQDLNWQKACVLQRRDGWRDEHLLVTMKLS